MIFGIKEKSIILTYCWLLTHSETYDWFCDPDWVT